MNAKQRRGAGPAAIPMEAQPAAAVIMFAHAGEPQR
jgi:hypothetical protein